MKTHLDDYVLLDRLAIGGMAEVFLARREARDDEPEPHEVVLKCLLPQYVEDAQFIHMLEHEAQLNAELCHPSLVRVLEYKGGSHPYIVMEYVDGLSLHDLLKHMKGVEQLPLETTISVTTSLLEALSYVHEATSSRGQPLNIVHRDVTPQNVLISRSGEVKLGDFGIARSALRDTRTKTGVIKGKLRYLAPEQVSGSVIDTRTDLYAVGLILWELVTGAPYIVGETEIELLRAAESPTFRKPSVTHGADERLDGLLGRVLRVFPEERFPSARAFITAIEQTFPTGGDARKHREVLASSVDKALRARSAPEKTSAGDEPQLALQSVTTHQQAQTQATLDLHLKKERVEQTPDTEPRDEVSRQKEHVRAPRHRWRATIGAWTIAASVVVVALLLLRWTSTDSSDSTEREARPQASDRMFDPASAPAQPRKRSAAPSLPTQEAIIHEDLLEAEGDGAMQEPSEAEERRLPTTSESGRSSKRSTPPSPPRSGRQIEQVTEVETEPEVEQVTEAEPSVEDHDRGEALRARLASLRRELRERGVHTDDLTATQRSNLSEVERLIDEGSSDEAATRLEQASTELRQLRIDGPFVQRKLDRVDAAVRSARSRGVTSPEMEELVRNALEAYVQGRYELANQRLNRLLRLLSEARRGP